MQTLHFFRYFAVAEEIDLVTKDQCMKRTSVRKIELICWFFGCCNVPLANAEARPKEVRAWPLSKRLVQYYLWIINPVSRIVKCKVMVTLLLRHPQNPPSK